MSWPLALSPAEGPRPGHEAYFLTGQGVLISCFGGAWGVGQRIVRGPGSEEEEQSQASV